MDFRSRTSKIASRIKLTLIQIDLSIALDDAQISIADADYRTHIKSPDVEKKSEAIKSKMIKIHYQNHLQNLMNARKKLMEEVDYALRGFPDSWRELWKLYYFTSMDVMDIGERTGYSGKTVRNIIWEMKREMENDNETESDGDQETRGDCPVGADEEDDPS